MKMSRVASSKEILSYIIYDFFFTGLLLLEYTEMFNFNFNIAVDSNE